MPVDLKLKMYMPHVRCSAQELSAGTINQPHWQAKAEKVKFNAQTGQKSIEAIPLTCSGSLECHPVCPTAAYVITLD